MGIRTPFVHLVKLLPLVKQGNNIGLQCIGQLLIIKTAFPQYGFSFFQLPDAPANRLFNVRNACGLQYIIKRTIMNCFLCIGKIRMRLLVCLIF